MRIHLTKTHESRDLVIEANEAFLADRSLGDRLNSSTLLIAGTHGDERATVTILENFLEKLSKEMEGAGPVAILCNLNPDGFVHNTRYNAKGIDLNRNFPHRWNKDSQEPAGPFPLSEPESLALFQFILKYRPRKIISLHWALAELDADGPQSIALAKSMWEALSLEEREKYRLRLPRLQMDSDLECTGSLGAWCGYDLIYPDGDKPAIVTLELPYHPFLSRPDFLPLDHLQTVQDLWATNPEYYISGVQEPVHRMLQAACALQIHSTKGNGL